MSAALTAMQAINQALILDKRPSNRFASVPHAGLANRLLGSVLIDLVEHGAHFDVGDIAEIRRTCGWHSCTGSFSTDIHGAALAVGNASAADSWERAQGWSAPWAWSGEQIANVAHRDGHGAIKGYERGKPPLKRLGATSAILLNGEWWRVYQIGAEELRLSQTPGDDGVTRPDTRKGIRRLTFTCKEWSALVADLRAAAKEAKA